jgi:hypothetical protein
VGPGSWDVLVKTWTAPPITLRRSGPRFVNAVWRFASAQCLCLAVGDFAFRQLSFGSSCSAGTRARYLPLLSLSSARYRPVSLVLTFATVFHPPLRRWIFTLTPDMQPSKVEDTFPLATRCRRSESVTVRS